MNKLLQILRPDYTTIYFIFIGIFLGCQQKEEQAIVSPQWELIGPGGGGATFIPTFSYSNEDQFIVRCDMTGAYLTKDGGTSYDQINFPNGSTSFAYDPLDSNTLYIGSATLNRSIDGGRSWDRIFPASEDITHEIFSGDHANYHIETKENSLYPTEGSVSISNIKIDSEDNKKIYFSIDNYFYYSKDGGQEWSRLILNGSIVFIYSNKFLKEEVYIFTSNSMCVLNKKNWTFSEEALPVQMQPAFSTTGGLIKGTKDVVFYSLHNNEPQRDLGLPSPTTLWRSNDFGKSWEQVKDSLLINRSGDVLPTFSSLAAAERDAANVYIIASLYVESTKDGPRYWYGSLKSSDSGKSWEWTWKGGGGSGQYGVKDGQDAIDLDDAWVQKAFGGEYIRLIDVGVAPNNGDVAIVTDWYRTMKTTDGGDTWKEIYSRQKPKGSYVSRGMDVTTAYGVHFDPFDKDHLAISYTDIGFHHSFDGGKSWERSTAGIPAEWHNTCYWVVFDPEVKGKVWSVWSGLHDFPRGKMTRNPKWREYGKGGVAVSVDGGKSWDPTIEGMGFDSPSTSIVLDRNSPIENRTLYVAAYGKGVFKSNNGGESWELRNEGIVESLAAFELTLLPDGTLFLITSPTPQHRKGKEGKEVFMGAVYKSVDGADSWQKVQVGERVLFPNGMAYDPLDPNRLYLGAWGDITLSDLVGKKVTGDSGNKRFDLEGGILMSEDAGNTWEQIFMEDMYVYDVSVDETHPGRLYCNTFNQGAYRSDDYGKSWYKIKRYDFHWGHRVIPDPRNTNQVFLTTFGSSVWHGTPIVEQDPIHVN